MIGDTNDETNFEYKRLLTSKAANRKLQKTKMSMMLQLGRFPCNCY